jgi:hypothetical protein
MSQLALPPEPTQAGQSDPRRFPRQGEWTYED